MRKRKKYPRRVTVKRALSFLGALLLGLVSLWYGTQDGLLQGKVTKVIDGDTVHIATAGEVRKVRLLGVDTPETVHPNKPVQRYGKEASAFTKKSLLGKTVWLEYDVAPLDRYGRHLVYLWLEKPGSGEEAIRRGLFNARLLLEGYGKTMTIQPNARYADLFARFQGEARAKGRGLWGK